MNHFLVQILGAIGILIWLYEPKTEMPIGGLNNLAKKLIAGGK